MRVYQWINGAWDQMGADIDGEAAYDTSGFSMALSDDGLKVAIGAPLTTGRPNAGHLRIYEWSGGVVLGADSTASAHDQLGRSIAMNRMD